MNKQLKSLSLFVENILISQLINLTELNKQNLFSIGLQNVRDTGLCALAHKFLTLVEP